MIEAVHLDDSREPEQPLGFKYTSLGIPQSVLSSGYKVYIIVYRIVVLLVY